MLNVYCNPCTSVNTTWNLNKQNTMLIHIAYNLNWKFECSLYQAFGRKRKYIPSCLHTQLLQVEFVSAPIKRSHALLEGVAFPWGHWSAMIRSNYVFFVVVVFYLKLSTHRWQSGFTFGHFATQSELLPGAPFMLTMCTCKCQFVLSNVHVIIMLT